MTLITGVGYPLVVTGISQAVFPRQAGGSLIVRDDKTIGSRLIGQSFQDPKYFWSRPSATAPQPYNGLASSGSNLGPLNPALTDAVKSRIDALHEATGIDAVPSTSSPPPAVADPDISVAAAIYQAAASHGWGIDPAGCAPSLRRIPGRFLGVFGEPRVNVLELNLALDDLK
jgi:K+-transporting ATPase ATPase C chain